MTSKSSRKYLIDPKNNWKGRPFLFGVQLFPSFDEESNAHKSNSLHVIFWYRFQHLCSRMKTAILGLFCVHFFRAVSCKGPSKNDVNSFSDFLNLPSPISTTFYYFPVLNNVAARNSLETRKICLHISIVLPVLELYI